MKQTFGLNQVNSTTPLWAKWFFRIVFFLNKILAAYIAATNLIEPAAKYEITLFLTLVIDPLAFGFSKMFGITADEKEDKLVINADAPEEPTIAGGGIQNPKP